MATQRYSITSKDGATYFTFSSPPPQPVRDKLRSDKSCSWLPFQKQWKCTSDARRQEIERILADYRWSMGQSVAPELAPLRVRTSTDATGAVRVAFNRKFAGDTERELAEKLKAVSCIDASDKLVWLCAAAKEAEVRNILSMYGVGDATDSAAPGSVPLAPPREEASLNMSHNNKNTITLTFPEGLPPAEKIAEMRGALSALGFVVSAKDDVGGGRTSDDAEDAAEEPPGSLGSQASEGVAKRPRLGGMYSAIRE